MHGILTVTLNPTIDLTTRVGEVRPQRKLRCSEPRVDPGGGGINVSRTIKELGGTSTTCVVLAGPTGERLRGLLEEAAIDLVPIEGDGDTRISFRVHETSSDQHYRFVLPGSAQRPATADRVMEAVETRLREGGIGYVVASGSLPPGVPDDTFARLGGLVRSSGARLVLDTSGPALEAACQGRPYLIKPNLAEARELAGREDGDPEDLARGLRERDAAEVVVISLGSDGALVAAPDEAIRIRSPEVDVVSTAGAGDCLIGGLTLGLARGWSLPEAARLGVAASAAAVMTEATELAHRDEVERLFDLIEPGHGT